MRRLRRKEGRKKEGAVLRCKPRGSRRYARFLLHYEEVKWSREDHIQVYSLERIYCSEVSAGSKKVLVM